MAPIRRLPLCSKLIRIRCLGGADHGGVRRGRCDVHPGLPVDPGNRPHQRPLAPDRRHDGPARDLHDCAVHLAPGTRVRRLADPPHPTLGISWLHAITWAASSPARSPDDDPAALTGIATCGGIKRLAHGVGSVREGRFRVTTTCTTDRHHRRAVRADVGCHRSAFEFSRCADGLVGVTGGPWFRTRAAYTFVPNERRTGRRRRPRAGVGCRAAACPGADRVIVAPVDGAEYWSSTSPPGSRRTTTARSTAAGHDVVRRTRHDPRTSRWSTRTANRPESLLRQGVRAGHFGWMVNGWWASVGVFGLAPLALMVHRTCRRAVPPGCAPAPSAGDGMIDASRSRSHWRRWRSRGSWGAARDRRYRWRAVVPALLAIEAMLFFGRAGRPGHRRLIGGTIRPNRRPTDRLPRHRPGRAARRRQPGGRRRRPWARLPSPGGSGLAVLIVRLQTTCGRLVADRRRVDAGRVCCLRLRAVRTWPRRAQRCATRHARGPGSIAYALSAVAAVVYLIGFALLVRRSSFAPLVLVEFAGVLVVGSSASSGPGGFWTPRYGHASARATGSCRWPGAARLAWLGARPAWF